MAELNTFIALGRGKQRRFVEVTATAEWVAKTGLKDERKVGALAIGMAYDAIGVQKRMEKKEIKPNNILLTTEMPKGSIPILGGAAPLGLDCFICLCDDSGKCVCTPC